MADQTQMQLVDWLDDLTVRFLLNLPASELSSMPRLCFQVEEAQWFYEDFVRPMAAAAGNPLPSLALRQFCLLLFQHCPLFRGFSDAELVTAYDAFLAYKVRVPVRGAILMTHDMEKLLLVKGWKKGASWSFPRGKINQEERDLDCAIREVYEETGYDVRQAGLVPEDEDAAKYIDVAIREQHIRLFVFRGVPEDTYFEPKTRKEISKIQWYNVRDLPGFRKQKQGVEQAVHTNKFYMVAPFLGPLKKWINQQRRSDTAAIANDLAIMLPEEEQHIHETHMIPRQPEIIDDKSNELKRLLSIGGTIAPSDTSKNLLALFQNAPSQATQGRLPTLPHETQTSQYGQSVYLNEPSGGRSVSSAHPLAQQPPPFQAQSMAPEGGSVGHSSGPWIYPLSQSSHGAIHEGVHHSQPLSPYRSTSQQFYHEGGASVSKQTMYNAIHSLPSSDHAPPLQQNFPQHLPATALKEQGSHGPIRSAPAAPNAENLPIPKLNAHSMSLLSTFRNIGPSTGGEATLKKHAYKHSDTHQKALLNLFKKPVAFEKAEATVSTGQPTSDAEKDARIPDLKAEHDVQGTTVVNYTDEAVPGEKDSKLLGQLSSQAKPSARPDLPKTQIKEQHDFPATTATTRRHTRSSPSSDKIISTRPTSPRTLIHKTEAKQPRSPKPRPLKSQSPAPKPKQISSPRQANQGKRSDSRQMPTTQFTILARPGSARGSPTTTEQGDRGTFLPQVLRRPEPGPAAIAQGQAADEPAGASQNGENKKERLLALFGKSSPQATSLPADTAMLPATTAFANPSNSSILPLPVATPATAPTSEESRRSNLLSLLGGTASTVTPKISPLPSANLGPVKTTPSQSSETYKARPALELFAKSSGPVPDHLQSPGTPISPFELGTPVRKHTTQPAWSTTTSQALPVIQTRDAKSRLSSVTSVVDHVTSPLGSGSATPTEAKGFLLDYLNGVVQKEGYRNNKK